MNYFTYIDSKCKEVITLFFELKKLLNVFIVLSVISGLCTVISFILLYDNRNLLLTDFKPFILICSYLTVSVPIVFISLTVVLKKIIRILISKDSALAEHLREIEKKQK